MKRIKFIFTFLFLLVLFCLEGQELNVEGHVSGYYFNSRKTLFSKAKDVELSGSLTQVSIQVYQDGELFLEKKSSSKGDFKFSIPLGNLYLIKLSKSGYEDVKFKLDLKNAQHEETINLKTLEIILNSFIKDKDLSKSNFFIGTIKYNTELFRNHLCKNMGLY